MFEPLQTDRNFDIAKKSMQRVVEPILSWDGKLGYERVEWSTQQDGSSCGVWCIAILEILLSDPLWDDCIYMLCAILAHALSVRSDSFHWKPTVEE